MSKVDKNVIDKVTKDLEKAFLPSRKTQVAFILIGVAIGYVSTFCGMSEEWASEVAKALITINGLVIGFTILGITVFSKRGYSEAIFRKSVEQSASRFINYVQDLEKEFTAEQLKEKFLSSLIYPFFDVIMLREVFSGSIKCSLISIGFALCLFGVSTEAVSNPLIEFLFVFVYSLSISTFIWGAYYIIYCVRAILEKATEYDTKQQFEIAIDAFERKVRDLKKELQDSDEKTYPEKT